MSVYIQMKYQYIKSYEKYYVHDIILIYIYITRDLNLENNTLTII